MNQDLADEADLRYDDLADEVDAISAGLAIVASPWTGDSDFGREMRLLQQHLGVSVSVPCDPTVDRPA